MFNYWEIGNHVTIELNTDIFAIGISIAGGLSIELGWITVDFY